MHAYRAADDVQRYAELGEYPDLVARARIRGDAAVALQNVNEAINTLLNETDYHFASLIYPGET